MANIKTHLNNIKNALFGNEVRGSIHDGIDAINKEVENTTEKQQHLEGTFEQLIINEGNSNAEIVAGRVKEDGTSFPTIGKRIADSEGKISILDTQVKEFLTNVKVYGATGDGVADDTESIKKADKVGGVLFFPKGVYITTHIPSQKCKGEGAKLVINDYEVTLSDVALEVNAEWQTYIRMNNTTIGLDCGNNLEHTTETGYANTAIGHNAMREGVTIKRNTAIGNNSQQFMNVGYGDTSVGVDSLHLSRISDRNTAIGSTAGKNIGNTDPHDEQLGNGLFNGTVDTKNNYDDYWPNWRDYAGNVGECKFIAKNPTDVTSNVAVGRNSLGFSQTPKRNVAIGYNALEGGIDASNCVAIGECSLQFGVKSLNSVFIGGRSGYHNMDNNQDISIGQRAMENTIHSEKNVAIGYQAMAGLTRTDLNEKPTSNVAIGRISMANAKGSFTGNIAIGESTLTTNEGNYNVAIGTASLPVNTNGSYNTAVGNYSLGRNTTGLNNTAIGYNSLITNQDLTNFTSFNNCTGVGYQTRVSGDNQVQLGNTDTTTYTYGSVQSRSDIRDKADIRDTILGLDFINKLRPVDFKWDYRDDYFEEIMLLNENGEEVKEIIKTTKDGSKKRGRYHHGLIAQDIEKIIQESGVDFGGFQNHKINGGCDVMSIGYEELIAPLIKAVQELSKKIEILESK